MLILLIGNILFDYMILETGIDRAGKNLVVNNSGKTTDNNKSRSSTTNNLVVYEKPIKNKIVESLVTTGLIARLISYKEIQNPVPLITENPKSLALLQKNQLPVIDYFSLKNPVSRKHNYVKRSRLITAFISYDQSGYTLDSDFPNSITSIRHNEDHEPSFSAGILATFPIKKNWSFQTGLVYTYTAIGSSPQKLYALQNADGDIAYKYITSSGYAYIKPGISPTPAFGDSLNAAEAKHVIQSLSVPIAINYTIGKKKLTFTPGLGIEANVITNTKVKIEIEDASHEETVFINKLTGSKTFYWSVAAQAELRYNISKKTALSLRPAFRHAISSVTENNEVETFPYSFGIGAGLTVKF